MKPVIDEVFFEIKENVIDTTELSDDVFGPVYDGVRYPVVILIEDLQVGLNGLHDEASH